MNDVAMRQLSEAELLEKHRRSIRNRDRLTGRCACFHCLSRFEADQVTRWVDDGETATCPFCAIDSVLGPIDLSGTEDVLEQMHERWFGAAHAMTIAQVEHAIVEGALPKSPR